MNSVSHPESRKSQFGHIGVGARAELFVFTLALN